MKSSSHVWHLFVIRNQNRKKLQNYLHANKIETLIHYPIPPHKQKAFKEWGDFSFPISEKIHKEVLSLPIGSFLSKIDQEKIIHSINAYET